MAECHLGVAGAKSLKKVLWVTVSFASSWCGPVFVFSTLSQPANPPSRLTVEIQSCCRAPCRDLSCGGGNRDWCLCPGAYLLNECCQRGDYVKPGEVSLRLGGLWGYGLPSSSELSLCGTGMIGFLVVIPSRHTWEKPITALPGITSQLLFQHQPIWEDVRIQGWKHFWRKRGNQCLSLGGLRRFLLVMSPISGMGWPEACCLTAR